MNESVGGEQGVNAPVPFLKSARAVPACARELEALGDAIVAAVNAWHGEVLAATLVDKPAARRSPGRCAVQVGPVALSFAWLPAPQQDVSAGELLVIVWHGMVGPRRDLQLDRAAKAPAVQTAIQLWEGVFHAGIVGGDSWRWCATDVLPEGGHHTAALAAHAVDRLQAAYQGLAA